MKRLILLFIILISLNSCAQNKVEEFITTPDGKRIETKNNDLNPNNLDKTVEEFYNNISEVSKLDNLISFRFYQKIPYNKFKELIDEKYKKFGRLKDIKKINTEFHPDKKAVKYTFDVTYENTKTKESLILIKENEKDNFKIIDYNYQEIK